MERSEIAVVSLSWKQKLILNILQDEFHGNAFGPQRWKESENEDIKKMSINEITWALMRLRDAALVSSEQKTYDGRVLNEYSTTEIVRYGAIEIR